MWLGGITVPGGRWRGAACLQQLSEIKANYVARGTCWRIVTQWPVPSFLMSFCPIFHFAGCKLSGKRIVLDGGVRTSLAHDLAPGAVSQGRLFVSTIWVLCRHLGVSTAPRLEIRNIATSRNFFFYFSFQTRASCFTFLYFCLPCNVEEINNI